MHHDLPSDTGLPPLDARLTAVLRYWDDLRGDRPVPGRVELRPTEISRHLSRICILERHRAGTVRIRLAGSLLSTRMGMELRGMPFRALFEMADRTHAMEAAETAIATPAISVLSLSRQERTGPAAEAMMAILPLSDTRGGLTRALAIYSERPAVTPFVSGIRGRFVIGGAWCVDIPETGPVMRPRASAPTGVRLVVRGGQARPAADPLEASRDAGPERAVPCAALPDPHADPAAPWPAFRVIEGGRA